MPGTSTLAAEVTHVSKHDFWLLLADEQLLVPFDQYLNLPLLNVHLSYSIMRPSFAVPRASFSQTASD